MASDSYLKELGQFLKAQRAKLSPRTVGLPDSGGRRRVAGLRREEVALLAAISTDYYTRLEQGRIQPSAPLLTTLAQVLHLDDEQRDHLFELTGRQTGRPRRGAAQKVQPQLRRLLDDLTVTPGVVLGRRMDVLAWNPPAAALLTDFAQLPMGRRNYARVLFTDPRMRSLYADWRTVARDAVSQLRTLSARYPDDARLTALVGELSVLDKDFGQWWAGDHAPPRNLGTRRFRHPVAGELVLDGDALTCGINSDQVLVVWTAEPGTSSYDGLRRLASRAGTIRA
ncbi:helix-turn-helix domain-containing protein [Streptomyces spinoverrucosus]|uniref:helix-turn-helix domain-containing protein n=1 Tax=Streptomyces spinoverrucosus TaxID=284043 RepID=UPI0018C401EC|nr:helix-turn-helix transcriptional regulator [Streptomyces spinoverrucosus]MBG0854568.1 helix-turn-helix domain-containing protein [Streptomyces spinoverrucosus]